MARNRKRYRKNCGCEDRPMTSEERYEIERHKCYGCSEGKREGMRFFCIRAQCVKEISNFTDS